MNKKNRNITVFAPVEDTDVRFEDSFGAEDDAEVGNVFALGDELAFEEDPPPAYDYDGEDAEEEDETEDAEEDDGKEKNEKEENDAEYNSRFPKRMFACRTAPSVFPGYDEIARLYAETRNEKYYEWILYYHEGRMTQRCLLAMRQNCLSDGLEDLKLAYAAGLYDALKKYDPNYGTPFMSFKKKYIKGRLNEALSVLLPDCTLHSVNEYRHLKTVMAIYAEEKEEGGTSEAAFARAMERAAETLGLSIKTVAEICIAATRNAECTPLIEAYETENGEEEVAEIVTPRTGPTTPEELFFADLRGNAIFSAYEGLPFRQRMVTSDACGFCDGCFCVQVLAEDKNGEPTLKERKALPLTQIAARNQLSDADTVKKILNKAVAAMREYLHGTDYFADTDFERIGKYNNDCYMKYRIRIEERKQKEASQKQTKKTKKKQLPPAV